MYGEVAMSPILVPVAFLLVSVSLAQAQELLVIHEFHVSEAGGFGLKTLKEMGSSEFQAIVTAACAA
jgi:hypothetical protein